MSTRGVPSAHLFFPSASARLCYGLVGTGAKRFCLKQVKEDDGAHTCGVSKHASKFAPELGMFYLKGNEATAFCHPAFPISLVPEDFKDSILTSKKTMEEWKLLFFHLGSPKSQRGGRVMRRNGCSTYGGVKDP